jgi:hypothetical protein
MTVPELQPKWAATVDPPAPNASRGNLELRLGNRLQVSSLGGLGREARRKQGNARFAEDKPCGAQDTGGAKRGCRKVWDCFIRRSTPS